MRTVLLLLLALISHPLRAETTYLWEVGQATAEGWPATTGEVALTPVKPLELADDFGRALVRGVAQSEQPLAAGWAQLTASIVLRTGPLTGGWQGIVGRDRPGGAEGDAWSLLLTPAGVWNGRLLTDQGQATLAAPATAGWHQLALTYDGQTARLVVDGAVAAEAPLRGTLVEQPGTPFTLGAYAGGTLAFRGGVARFELRDTALAPEALAAAWGEWQTAHPEPNEFWFAEASDIHITDTRSVEIVNRAVDAINADPRIRFSLWLGDLTQSSTPDQMILARLALSRLEQPRYTVRGNHDQASGVYEAQFGPLQQTFEVAGWKFILFDTNPGDKTPVNAETLAWLQTQIDATPATQPVVLGCHHPLMPHTKAYALAGAAELVQRFSGHNLRACLSGHFHGNQEEIVDGILYTTTATLSSTRENHDRSSLHGYRLFHCKDGEITTEFVPVE